MRNETEKYEISFLVPEDSSSKECVKLLELSGAKISKETDLGVKKLVYPITKITSARLCAVVFEMVKADLPKLEKSLRLEKTIIRYLIIKELPVSVPKPAKEGSAEKSEAKIAEAPVEKKEILPEPKAEEKIVEAEKKIEKVEKPAEAKKIEKKEEIIEEKPKKRKTQKPIKIAADQLDKKLEELTLD